MDTEQKREVTHIKEGEAVSKAYQTMARHKQENRGNLAMAFRRGIRDAQPELTDRLVKLNARSYWAGDDRTRDEVVEGVISRVTAFVVSCARGERGGHIGSVNREMTNAITAVKMGTRNRFKLAVDELEESMKSPLAVLAKDEITLVKPDGSEHKTKAQIDRGKIFVFDTSFPVAVGDEIRHVLPSGVVQLFKVIDPGFISGPGGTSHYEIQVRNAATAPAVPTPSVVHNHFNNNGIANVMGPDGVASGNTNNMQITHQTLNIEDPRIEGELAQLRKALDSERDNDDDAAIEAGNVVSAQKALKAGDEGGFRAAMKRLGAKAWSAAEGLALAWMTTEGRRLLGLPPGQ